MNVSEIFSMFQFAAAHHSNTNTSAGLVGDATRFFSATSEGSNLLKGQSPPRLNGRSSSTRRRAECGPTLGWRCSGRSVGREGEDEYAAGILVDVLSCQHPFLCRPIVPPPTRRDKDEEAERRGRPRAPLVFSEFG